MKDIDRIRLLHGPYASPRCKLGKRLFCEIRGWVPVKRISDGRIAWPQTIVGRNRAFILCGDLVTAVRRESNIAICFWWGVTPQTVTQWRKVLDVPRKTEGTTQLFRLHANERFTEEVRSRAHAAANTPEANAKKAAAKLGKTRPRHVIEKLRQANLGRPFSAEHRRKLSEARRRRGGLPPAAGKTWTPEEVALLGTIPDEEVAARTGRTVVAVWSQRQKLRIPSFRRKGPSLSRKIKRQLHREEMRE